MEEKAVEALKKKIVLPENISAETRADGNRYVFIELVNNKTQARSPFTNYLYDNNSEFIYSIDSTLPDIINIELINRGKNVPL